MRIIDNALARPYHIEKSTLTMSDVTGANKFMSDKQQAKSSLGVWRENHGNFLLGFAVVILLVGSGILVYQQQRKKRSAAPRTIRVVEYSETDPDVPQEDEAGNSLVDPSGSDDDSAAMEGSAEGPSTKSPEPDSAAAANQDAN